jgi:hypothetical protein
MDHNFGMIGTDAKGDRREGKGDEVMVSGSVMCENGVRIRVIDGARIPDHDPKQMGTGVEAIYVCGKEEFVQLDLLAVAGLVAMARVLSRTHAGQSGALALYLTQLIFRMEDLHILIRMVPPEVRLLVGRAPCFVALEGSDELVPLTCDKMERAQATFIKGVAELVLPVECADAARRFVDAPPEPH